MNHTGKLLKEMRIKKGYSAKDAISATHVDFTKQFFSHIETGRASLPVKYHKVFASAYNMPVKQLSSAYLRDVEERYYEELNNA